MDSSESSPLPFVDKPDRALIPKPLRDYWVPLLAEEVERRVLGLNCLVALGTAILTTLSFVGEKGVEDHIFSTLKRNVTGNSVIYHAMTAEVRVPCSEGRGSLQFR